MSLAFKPDIIETLERYKMWWNREDFGRCAISIRAWKGGGSEKPELPARVGDRWLDFDYLKAAAEYRLSNTEHIAEALPIWDGGYPGHDGMCAFLGCDIEFGPETAWVSPIIEEGELNEHDPNGLMYDFTNKWWLHSLKYHAFENECAAGKSIPAVAAMGATGDTLAALRTSNKLLYDVLDQPEAVKLFEARLMTLFIELYERYFQTHLPLSFGGSVNWMGLWAPGRFYIPQNDFSYMISPAMFKDLFLEPLIRQIEYLDYSIFHVDGIGVFNHVDMLCSIDKLNALQILPGAGKPSPLYYMNILKKVQSRGKNLHISIPPEEVVPALDNLSSKGLYIDTYCKTPEEGHRLLKLTEAHSRFY